MKQIAPALRTAFVRRMEEQSVAPGLRNDYLTWLRFFLDFCERYRHPPRDAESLLPYLQKIADKGQSAEKQRVAAASVTLYHELMRSWSTAPEADAERERRRDPWDECYRRMKEEVRLRQYSPKTLRTYAGWMGQFQAFLHDKDPTQVASDDARRFLTHLATDRQVVAATQNQAFNALLFLFRHVLKAPFELGDSVQRARRSRFIPVVLSRAEVDRIVERLPYPYNLAIRLMYGCGLRLSELLNLRVQGFNFDEALLTIRQGKGRKDRVVPLPQVLVPALREHLDRVRHLHRLDLEAGFDGAFMPGAGDGGGKWKNTAKDFIWQWFFPAKGLTLVPVTGEHRRYHVHETQLHLALRKAVREAQIDKRVSSHAFRHSFASHLLRANVDIRTIQQLLGHSDLKTTMIYTHTVQSRTLKEARSPLDLPPEAFS